MLREKIDEVGILATPLEFHQPKLPGLGDVPWGEFFAALTDVGYDGAVCIEVEDRAYEGSLDDRNARCANPDDLSKAIAANEWFIRQCGPWGDEHCRGDGWTDGKIVAERTAPTLAHEGPAAVLERITSLVNTLARKRVPAGGTGIGVPGLANLAKGRTEFLPNLPTQWRGVAVREALAPRLGCPVYVLNDARMATLGELVYGRGRSENGHACTMVFYTLGTGVGGGVVVDGRLRLGPLGAAGELGHQTIVPDGALCGCGNRGCLETLASGPAIAAEGVRLILCGQAPRLHDWLAVTRPRLRRARWRVRRPR